METFQSIISEPDRVHGLPTSSRPSEFGWMIGWRQEISIWLRSLELKLAQAVAGWSGLARLGARRWQPIPVTLTLPYSAPPRISPRGKVVRI